MAGGHATGEGLVRIPHLHRTGAGTRRIDYVIDADGIVRSSTGVHRLLQGESGGVVAVRRRVHGGLEGVVVAAGFGTAGLDDLVDVAAD